VLLLTCASSDNDCYHYVLFWFKGKERGTNYKYKFMGNDLIESCSEQKWKIVIEPITTNHLKDITIKIKYF
jgi:hypothetical protein